jgi:ribosomal-protein-alanine N-acetyltransferase
METQNLICRPFTLDDAQAYWPLVSLPEIQRYTGEQPVTSLEQVRKTLIERPLRDYAVHGFGRMACIEKQSGRLVGFSGIKYLEELQEVDVGYRFLPDCWGKGYATESALALMEEARRRFGIERFFGMVQPENVASARVLQKLGLAFERSAVEHGMTMDFYATPGTGRQHAYRPRQENGHG